jgi:hypothetical protein
MTADMREANMVQFYSNNGVHLRTLRVPGTGINALSWEGGGLRIALAVDSYIYFANIRPDYKWGYFAGTLVYAFNKLDRAEQCVMFWDSATNERFPKYVKSLLAIRAHGEYCVLATKGEEDDQYILILCNAIGTPVDSKYIEVEPLYITMTHTHVVVCSEELVYVWQYSTHVRPPSGLARRRAAFATRGSRCARHGWDDVNARKRIGVMEAVVEDPRAMPLSPPFPGRRVGETSKRAWPNCGIKTR